MRKTAHSTVDASPLSVYTTVQRYADCGISLIPLRTDGSKAPDRDYLPDASWKCFQQRQADDNELRRMFDRTTPPGIALVHGGVSGNLETIDFDQPEAYNEYCALMTEHGGMDLLAKLIHVHTPGGCHLTYRCEEPVEGNQKLARFFMSMPETESGGRWLNGQYGQIKAKIETRGEGGYTVAPGSPAACHPTGKVYRLVSGDYRNIPIITVAERAFLFTMAHACTEIANEPIIGKRAVDSPNLSASELLRPGDDFNQRGAEAALELLEAAGWAIVGKRGEGIGMRRPGKQRGLSATFGVVGPGVFYVFTSSGGVFENDRAYSPFAVYAFLKCDGDFTEAARQLGMEGYGEPPMPQATTPPHYGNSASVASPQQDQHSLLSVRRPAARQAVAWPEPMEKEAYYGLVGDIVRALDPHTESDPHAILIQTLTFFGNVIGRSAYYPFESDRHYGNLFCAVVGVSGKGRKGTSYNNVRALFAEVDPEWTKERIKSGLASGEGLIEVVRDDATGTVDTTDKRLLSHESELASVLRVMEREGNTISARLRDAWDTGNLATLTRKDPAIATGTHISMVGHITRDELLRYLKQTETANGFANRFLWICAKRSKMLPHGGAFMDDPIRPVLIARLKDAVSFSRSVERLHQDAEARHLWETVYPKLTSDTPGLFGAVTSRAEAQVTRLAIIYALLDSSFVIRKVYLMAALAVWEYARASARYIFGDALGDPEADRLLSALRASESGLTRTQLWAALGRNQDKSAIQRALDVLDGAGLVRMVKETSDKPGPDAEVWQAC